MLWDVTQTIGLALLIFFSIRVVAQNFKVEGASMEPTLHNGQFLIIVKAAYARVDGTPFEPLRALAHSSSCDPCPVLAAHEPDFLFGGPERGDIAVFLSPTPPERDFIKRVVGLPGDIVEVRGGRVHLNGVLQEEPYIRGPANYQSPPQVVPRGEYFVLGDNRSNSSDSHIWGFLPADNLIGKAWLTYWPPPLWGILSGA
ncbi:MAG: signal peptidase I [Chloroflexi bacterium]|nr:signal peptidase I [Chloroflexota bacterium]